MDRGKKAVVVYVPPCKNVQTHKAHYSGEDKFWVVGYVKVMVFNLYSLAMLLAGLDCGMDR